jgi:rsbT co-antagonist protein RsbR
MKSQHARMNSPAKTRIPDILKKYEGEILEEWRKEQETAVTRQQSLVKNGELREQSKDFVRILQTAAQTGNVENIEAPEWSEMRDLLTTVSRARGLQGMTPSETATFVFSFKKPLFARMTKELGNNAETLAAEMWMATALIDRLGLFTTEAYQISREEVIRRQQQELLELSTPVVKLWKGILALPLIGTLDSARTQVVMESLLQKIVETGSDVAIIDITGVPTVDTLVAQHLLKTVTAARLMGAECIISGIRPQIAQTIVHLGVQLGDVTTKSNLADAFAVALKRSGASLVRGRQNAHVTNGRT